MALGSLLAIAPPVPRAVAAAATPAAASSCRVGSYLTDLYNVDPAQGTFYARFWLWSLCPRKSLDPLPLAAFTNGDNPSITESQQTIERGLYRHLVLVQGQFRQPLDMRDYPFDAHTLRVIITAAPVTRYFRFVPDTADSGFSHGILLPGWRITGFQVTTTSVHFTSNFGIITLPPGTGSTHSRLVLRIGLADSNGIVFAQLTGPLFIVFLITLLTFLLTGTDAASFSGRIAALGAALFTVVLNMEKVDGAIPDTSGLTMVDDLHLITLLYVLLAMAITVACWRMAIHGHEAAKIKRLNQLGILAGLVGYVTAATVIITLAVTAG